MLGILLVFTACTVGHAKELPHVIKDSDNRSINSNFRAIASDLSGMVSITDSQTVSGPKVFTSSITIPGIFTVPNFSSTTLTTTVLSGSSYTAVNNSTMTIIVQNNSGMVQSCVQVNVLMSATDSFRILFILDGARHGNHQEVSGTRVWVSYCELFPLLSRGAHTLSLMAIADTGNLSIPSIVVGTISNKFWAYEIR